MVLAIDALAHAPVLATSSVRALYVHGPEPTQPGASAPTPMIAVPAVEAVQGKGLHGDTRFFHATRRDGSENLRQVSLIDEASLDRHSARFGDLPWELVKSQIVLAGTLRLPDLVDHYLVFGDAPDAAVLQITLPRQPCFAMDLIAEGLRAAMEHGEQGALARVVRGGIITVRQSIKVL